MIGRGPARYYVIYLRRVLGSRPVPRSLSVFPIPTAALSAHRCQPVGGWYGYTRRVSHPRDHHHPITYSHPSDCQEGSFLFLFSHNVASHRQRAVVDKSFPSNRTYGFLRYRKLQSRWCDLNISIRREDIYRARRTATAVVPIVIDSM